MTPTPSDNHYNLIIANSSCDYGCSEIVHIEHTDNCFSKEICQGYFAYKEQ